MPIKILPPQLANQIAAGEVVERPASVVKELIENSLDAEASQIDIELEKGGHKKLLIRDNGKGIGKDELGLALSRHATSKIASLDDLEQIASLGFRGEALASISAVSRLTLTSKTAEQSEAWQARAEGRDMQVETMPAAHPKGTSVQVLDLFFNTPARRKFLRSEKTEFQHIDEVVKRIALSRFEVGFSLKHNGRVVRKLPAIRQGQDPIKRVAAIMPSGFAEQAFACKSQYQHMQLSGWISGLTSLRAQADAQYVYVNGRMMKDKLINHAIRQAYTEQGVEQGYPQFVLYLQLPPQHLDINVHPAKHEVRFQQSRLVHDFIYQGVSELLTQQLEQVEQGEYQPVKLPSAAQHQYIQPLTPVSGVGEAATAYQASRSYPSSTVQSSGAIGGRAKVSQPIDAEQQWLVETTAKNNLRVGQFLQLDESQLLIVHQQRLYQLPYTGILAYRFEQQPHGVAQPLLMPVAVSADTTLNKQAQQACEKLMAVGIEIGCTQHKCLLRKVPAGLREIPWSALLVEVITQTAASEASDVKRTVGQLLGNAGFGCSGKTQQTLLAYLQTLSGEDFSACLHQWGCELTLEQDTLKGVG